MSERLALLESLMNSLKDLVVFVDTDHVIQYMNKAAVKHYEGKSEATVGRSIFDCHNENSNAIIRDVLVALQNGEEEKVLSEGDKQRIFMRAVRDENGELLGYFERYETVTS